MTSQVDDTNARRLGVIDVLSLGFQLALRRPWLLALPVLLDLLLWFGPRISVMPLVSQLSGLLQQPYGISEEMQQMADFSRQSLVQFGERWNLLGLLARGLASVPSFLADALALLPSGTPRPAVEVSSVVEALAWGLPIALLGTLLGALFLTLIADQLRRTSPEMIDGGAAIPESPWLVRLGLTWIRLILLSLMLLVGLLLLMVPLSLVAGLLALLSPTVGLGAAALLTMFGFPAVLWASFVLHFVSEAVVLDEVSALQAVWRSAGVVWRNLWPSLGLVLLSYIIGAGFTFIWDRFANTTWGTALGVLGTAFIGTGLAAAGLAFYADRRRQWRAQSGRSQA
jgi:hypothetical protein